MYRRGLYTTGNRGNAPPEKTQSLPVSSRESSTEPMDTDDARLASEEIYRRIRQQAGLSRSGSAGDITLQPEPLGIMTQGKLVLRRRMPKRSQAGQTNVENPETTAGAVGGETLLNIPPCSMAEGPGEQSQSLFRPPMSDLEVDLERRRGARPKVAGPLTTQTKQEEAKATLHQRACTPGTGYRFLFTVRRPTQDFRQKFLEGPHCDRTREPWNLCTDR